jgi:hypothetical protein
MAKLFASEWRPTTSTAIRSGGYGPRENTRSTEYRRTRIADCEASEVQNGLGMVLREFAQ